ncbi:uncharacterized protein LOC108252116 isoform X1 [Diaphorina citri]|uniref:Uncharacterized protein LOC108252116 isoform X1 n=1 Tax=Diaphorina citri TaxID=121845 RepID=A0A1S4E8V4_DIACI|nr:uncharacterized protein LOC108252116 isoform X1 [Diaphorina citri]
MLPHSNRRRQTQGVLLIHTIHISLDVVDISAGFFHTVSSSSISNINIALIKQQIQIGLRRRLDMTKGKPFHLLACNPLRHSGRRRRGVFSAINIKIHDQTMFN